MIRVALYKRVSTDEQAKEGFSLPAQDTRLRAYAVAQGWTVTGDYTDGGHSGRTTKRPEYLRMMQERELWDLVLVLKMDRIHRNSRNFMAMMDDLRRWGKQFASVTESLDTGSAMGRFVMDIIQRIAQLESEQNGERTKDAMAQKARQGGGALGSPAPYGYRWSEGKLVIVPEEAEHVRWLFECADKYGWTAKTLANHLNAKSVKTRNGRDWTYWNVSAILENPVYRGHTLWDGILQRDTHEPIVAEAL